MNRRTILQTLGAGVLVPASLALMAAPAQARQNFAANKDLVRRFYEPFMSGALDLYDELLTENWVEHPPAAPDQAPGRAGYKPVVQQVRTMLPDIRFDIEALVAEGDMVAVRSTLSATHSTDAFGIPATGRRFAILTMDMHRIERGRIAETWHVEDWAGMRRQIGANG